MDGGYFSWGAYLPHLLFGIAGIALVLFSIVSIMTGTSLGSKTQGLAAGQEKSARQKALQVLTLFQTAWAHTKMLILKWLRFFGFLPERPIFNSFRHVQLWLKENLEGPDYAYQLPWYLVVGEEESGKTTLLSKLPLTKPTHQPDVNNDKAPLNWWFYDAGVMIDVNGSCFLNSNPLEKTKNWREVLRNLLDFRVRRPIDGVILTIPCTSFTGTTKLSQDDLIKKATEVAKQLKDAEAYIGLKLPIYIMVTKCDAIAGFSGFCTELPSSVTEQIFGWSTPYNLDKIYSPQWVQTAFQTLGASLTKLTFDIFEQGKIRQYQDDVMIFPSEFGKIEAGITQYLNTIFQSDNYQDHFLLRGLYFTGNASVDEADQSVLSLENSIDPHTAYDPSSKIRLPFLSELFQSKVFPESTLASPIKRFLLSANRKINYMKAAIILAIVLGITCLYFGKKEVRHAVETLYPEAIQVSRSIENLKLYEETYQNGSIKVSDTFFQDQSIGVLNFIVHANKQNFNPYYLPGSLLFPFKNKLQSAVRIAYDKIIARSIYLGLMDKANRIISYPLPPFTIQNTDGSTLVNPLETSEFIILQGYVDAVQMLERNVTIYQHLKDAPTVDGFAFLINYLYNFPLPIEFINSDQDLSLNLISQANYKLYNLDNYRLLAQKRLFSLFMTFLTRILDPSFNYTFAQNLQKTLQEIDNTTGSLPKLQELQNALSQLRQLREFINSPDLSWMGNSTFNPGGSFEEMMADLSSIKLFDANFIRHLTSEATKLFQQAKQNLGSYGSPLTGFFVTTSPLTQSFDASPGLQSLEIGLSDFLAEPFLQPASGKKFETLIKPDEILYWDAPLIKTATSLIKTYYAFLKNKLPSYPADLQESFRLIGKNQLRHNLNDLLARAQKIVPLNQVVLSSSREAMVKNQILNLQSLGEEFLDLLKHLNQSGDFETYLALRDLISNQMYQALSNIDKMLTDEGLFEPYYAKFDWWTGNENVILQAYDMSDKIDLATYIQNEVIRMAEIATQYAQPLVEFLGAPVFTPTIQEAKLLDRWKRILTQINDLKQKKVNNSVSVLEKFLLDIGNKITFQNCFKEITPQDVSTTSGDYFLQKRNDIRNRVYQQCQVLAGDFAVKKYNQIAEYFNSNIAGNFPFVARIDGATLPTNEVTPQTIMNFFNLYDGLSDQEKDALSKNPAYANTWHQIQSFLDQMAVVKEFFDDYFMPQTPNGTPGIDFKVEFRANTMYEVSGHYVIDWGFVSGDTTYDIRSGKTTGRWNMGQVAAFAFKWAANAPLKPLLRDPHYPALANVNERSIYMYEGQWALLRAMMLHQAKQSEGALPGDSSLLSFTLPLSMTPNLSHAESHAVLYVRVIPQATHLGVTKKFNIPFFPAVAPPLFMQ
jgi:type VI secretion system protein ImpL